jgi:hypothetical protein
LKKDSAFDCNRLFERTILQLTEKRTAGRLKFVGTMPSDIINKLINGVVKSPLITRKAKKIIKRSV